MKQAVEGLLQAVMANPELLRTLADRLTPPTPEGAAGTAQGKASGPRQAGGVLAAVRRQAGALVDGVRSRLRLARLPLSILGLGGVASATATLAGPWLAWAAGCLVGLARHGA